MSPPLPSTAIFKDQADLECRHQPGREEPHHSISSRTGGLPLGTLLPRQKHGPQDSTAGGYKVGASGEGLAPPITTTLLSAAL